jgi:rsbT co-antagonist protein RsbR
MIMPDSDLAPLGQRMDARFDELVEQLTEQLPGASSFYSALPLERRREASLNLYKILRDSVEPGGIERFSQAITQIARTRMAQGGTPDDLQAATDMIRQMNLTLVEDLVRDNPGAAAPAFTWLDRLASVSLGIFNGLAREALAQQAEELNILIALSERIDQLDHLDDTVAALFEQLPRLGVDRAIVSIRADDTLLHEVVGVFDRDAQAPARSPGARFALEALLRTDTSDAVCLTLDAVDIEVGDGERELLALADITTLAVFPLRSQGSTYGLLILGYRQAHRSGPGEQRFLASLVRLLRNRITNQRLIERLRQHVERATIFQTLVEQANDMIVITDLSGTITYANAAAAQLLEVERPGDLVDQPFIAFLGDADRRRLANEAAVLLAAGRPWRGEFALLTAAGAAVPVATSSIPLVSAEGRQIGMASIMRDERDRLALVESLQRSNDEQEQLLLLLRQLSTPLVPLMEGILVMPLVGDLDSRRAGQVMEMLLEGVTRASADIVILDITGVPLVDTGVANALIQAARAVRLLGAEAMLVGITPDVAQALVSLGVDLSELVTRSDLQSGIAYALRRRGYRIVRADGVEAG